MSVQKQYELHGTEKMYYSFIYYLANALAFLQIKRSIDFRLCVCVCVCVSVYPAQWGHLSEPTLTHRGRVANRGRPRFAITPEMVSGG
jgi:hypothetical protein